MEFPLDLIVRLNTKDFLHPQNPSILLIYGIRATAFIGIGQISVLEFTKILGLEGRSKFIFPGRVTPHILLVQ